MSDKIKAVSDERRKGGGREKKFRNCNHLLKPGQKNGPAILNGLKNRIIQ